MKKTNKLWLICGLWLVIVFGAGPVQAMKALSDDDLGGVSGMAGLTIFGQDLDATLLQMDDFLIDLSPSVTADWQFLIVDDSKSRSLYTTNDNNSIAAALCGSSTDESVPINVDTLGFEIDVGTGDMSSDGLMTPNAVTFAMTGYGSTEMHYVWELVQFQSATTTYDVFGFHIGEIFWLEEYDDPEPNHFAQLFLTPPSHYDDAAFFDSWMSPAYGSWGGLTAGQIRSNEGIAGELRLKLGGGELNFRGFDVDAKGSSIMFAGDIAEGTPYWNGSTWMFPNTQTLDVNDYYTSSVSNWHIIGDFAAGVHHARTHDTSGYPYPGYAASQIGQSSPTRPIRFETATADAAYDADADGRPDTYLVTYVHGHYSRTVYYPDSAASGMGVSSGAVPSNPARRHYILGEVRIGQTGWATADKDGDGINESVNHVGSWVLNDLSMPYTKAVIPGQRNLVQEVSAASEPFLIPNVDYRGNQISFLGNPTSTSRNMSIAGTFNGYVNPNPTSNHFTEQRANITVPASGWQ